jgi:hypothetical protein
LLMYKERFYNKQNISQFGKVWFWAIDILFCKKWAIKYLME